MVRFFDFQYPGLAAAASAWQLYVLKGQELRNDVLCSIQHSHMCDVDRLSQLLAERYGALPKWLVFRLVKELKREGQMTVAQDELTYASELQLTTAGKLNHTCLHIVRCLRADKKQLAPA